MAVFTQVAIEELNHFLSQYNIGELYGYEEIKEGRENYESNVSFYTGDRYSNDTELYPKINEFELFNRKTLEGYFSGPVPFFQNKLTSTFYLW